jgi:hypothetical protein
MYESDSLIHETCDIGILAPGTKLATLDHCVAVSRTLKDCRISVLTLLHFCLHLAEHSLERLLDID